MYYTRVDSPVGELLVAGDGEALHWIGFQGSAPDRPPGPSWEERPRRLAPVLSQLRDYFRRRRRNFELNVALDGTPFQRKVWRALQDIPYGETISYGEVARRIGRPSASRAVGAANGRNPIPIVIPCHRVIGSNGSLTGFGGGLAIKEALLALERDP